MDEKLLPGAQADAELIVELLERVIAKTGYTETTVCQRYLRDNGSFRDRLLQGRMAPRKMRASHNTLKQLLD